MYVPQVVCVDDDYGKGYLWGEHDVNRLKIYAMTV